MTEELIIERTKSRQKIEGEHFSENIFLDFTGENLNGTYDLKFVNCTFSKRLTIKEIKAAHLFVTFENCTIPDFFLINSEIYTLTVRNCTFSNFSIGTVTIIGFAKISMIGTLETYLYNITCPLFQFEYNDKEQAKISLNSPLIEIFSIKGLHPITSFTVLSAQNVTISGYFETILISSSKLQLIEVVDSNNTSLFNEDSSNITIPSLITEIRILTCPSTTDFILDGCFISRFLISRLIQSNSNISLFHVTIGTLVNRESIFKNVILNNTKIGNWVTIFSDVSGIKYYNQDWIKINFAVSDNENNHIYNNKAFRDLYRQLKVAAINMKNKPDELFFTQKELEYYERHLKEEQKGLREEKIVLKLDRISSLHGQSWWRPLWLLFVIHTFLFLFFKESRILNCNICLCEIRCLFISLFNNLSDYLTLIIPTHNLTIFKDLLPKDYIVSFLMRINTIYFSYHIVRSLRKYGNK